MNNNERAVAQLDSIGIPAKVENDTTYVFIGDVQLELAEFEINFRALENFAEEVDKISQDKYSLAYTSENGKDCPVLKGALENDETPSEFVEWWANKYGLREVI